MSSSLMSCVRENSPPLKMTTSASGPMSLPETSRSSASIASDGVISSTPLGGSASNSGMAQHNDGAAAPHADQQKRRRFHPLRNLRRIFRRRTITSVADTPSRQSLPPHATASENNLRSATLSSISSVVSASSPSSPLTHQQLQETYTSHSLPKSKSYTAVAGKPNRSTDDTSLSDAGKGSKLKVRKESATPISKAATAVADGDMYTTTTTTTSSYHQRLTHSSHSGEGVSGGAVGAGALLQQHHQQHQRQSLGVAVLPSAMTRSFFAERQKLQSIGDSTHELDSSGNEGQLDGGGGGGGSGVSRHIANVSSSTTRDTMSDSQRSLSENRLVDSDYLQDPLSQSHDSVFSESATASSLSIVLKAELADVLRKRRNRPDGSDEDLGLPRSPVSLQQRAEHHKTTTTTHSVSNALNTSNAAGHHSGVSTSSLLSIASNDGDDFLPTSTANSSLVSTSVSSEKVLERTTSSACGRYLRSTMSMSSDLLRHSTSANFNDSKDEIDLLGADRQRLSHAAAKHKMAVRPAKKKGPSRHHRRTLENSIPESSEDTPKLHGKEFLDVVDHDAKAKTRSLPPSVSAKLLEPDFADNQNQNAATISTATFPSVAESSRKRSKTEKAQTTSSEKSCDPLAVPTTTTFSAQNLFGLRALSSKATSIFDHKDTGSSEEEKKPTEAASSAIETAESGFLRRLIQRNSKRTISKANGDECDSDLNQSEPKKMQISTSCYEARNLSTSISTSERAKSSLSPERNVTETRKDVIRETQTETKAGLSTVLNSFMMAEKTNASSKEACKQTQKPKSGPAARQRYLPQEIQGGNTLEKKIENLQSSTDQKQASASLNQVQETFQSTSIIREITASQAALSHASLSTSRIEHHFEKKPKIVGLSAFQQKVSRSNDSLLRACNLSNNNSVNSLESSGEAVFINYEQKQRKAVEKSRSFRTYDEKNVSANGMHSNMPSLPDLTLNLRVPGLTEFVLSDKEYSLPSPPDANAKCVSLGFEINDNNLVKSPSRTDSTSTLLVSPNSSTRNVILTAASHSRTTASKFLTAAGVVPSLSPTTNCNKNISEIEQNIDLIVKSPFISVVRKSTTENIEATSTTTSTSTSTSTSKVSTSFSSKKVDDSRERVFSTETKKVRPQVLNLKEDKFVDEKLTPTTAAVPLREKHRQVVEVVTPKERKSAPATNSGKPGSLNCTKRSSSVTEGPSDGMSSEVPEFMKIQLNRVNPSRMAKSTVVLAKNVKESAPQLKEPSTERCSSADDLSLRRYSNESVEIVEKESADCENSSSCFEAVNKQAKSSSANSIRSTSEALTPKSPTKAPLIALASSPTESEDPDSLRSKANEPLDGAPSSKLSLQERKRLFLKEEKAKTDKRIEELRNERKKSITEEVMRKSFTKSEERLESTASSTTIVMSPLTSEAPDNAVILRKKSFGTLSSQSSSSGKDDPTPELMKVFARRSLKIKDEDVDKIMLQSSHATPSKAPSTTGSSHSATANGSALKKFPPPQAQQQSNVDSDKENQSSSEEKLDKLPKFDSAIEQPTTVGRTASGSNGSAAANNRNTMADFRNVAEKSHSISNGLTLSNSNNNNNNNNNNSNNNTNNNGSLSSKGLLPPIKISSFRTKPIDRNSSVGKLFTSGYGESTNNNNKNQLNNNNNHNHNNNNNNNNNSSHKAVLERQTYNFKPAMDIMPNVGGNTANTMSKVIERSATVSEFKGIHQRRAEWEQRAKEALK